MCDAAPLISGAHHRRPRTQRTLSEDVNRKHSQPGMSHGETIKPKRATPPTVPSRCPLPFQPSPRRPHEVQAADRLHPSAVWPPLLPPPTTPHPNRRAQQAVRVDSCPAVATRRRRGNAARHRGTASKGSGRRPLALDRARAAAVVAGAAARRCQPPHSHMPVSPTPACLCRASSATRTPQSRRDCGCWHAAAATGGAAATAAAIAATLLLHWGWGEGRRWGGWRRAAADTDGNAASECKRALRPALPKGTSGSTTARVAAGADYRPSIRCPPVRPPSTRHHAQRARLRSGSGAQGQRRRRRRRCPPPAGQPPAVGQPSGACASRGSRHGQCSLWAACHLPRRSLLHVACSSTTLFESSRMWGAHVWQNTTSTSNNR